MNGLDLAGGSAAPAAGARESVHHRWLAASFWLLFVTVWLLGVLIRVPLLVLDTHITNDIEVYRRWFQQIGDQGLLQAYSGTGINYPPLYIEWLAFAPAMVARLPAWLHNDVNVAIFIVKLPALLADLFTAAVLAAAVRGLGRWTALGVLAAYLFNPAVWYVSAFWGQTDGLYGFFLVLAVLALQRGAVVPAWVSLALALGWKVQAAAVSPLLIVASLRLKGWRQLGAGLVAFILTSALIWAPWLLTGQTEVFEKIRPPAGPLVVSAYNLWYLVRGGDVARFLATESVPGLPFTFQFLSRAMFLAALLAITAMVWRASRLRLAVAAALYCLALFVFVHGVHERYLFPVLALLVLGQSEPGESADARRSLWLAYGLLTVTWLFNLVTIASFNHDWWINIVAPQPETIFVRALRIVALLVAATHVLAVGWLFWWLSRPQRQVPAAP